jgi:hypothetical protein
MYDRALSDRERPGGGPTIHSELAVRLDGKCSTSENIVSRANREQEYGHRHPIATLKAVFYDAYETFFDRGGIKHYELFWLVAFTFAIVVGHFQGKLKVKGHQKGFILILTILALYRAHIISGYMPMLLAR